MEEKKPKAAGKEKVAPVQRDNIALVVPEIVKEAISQKMIEVQETIDKLKAKQKEVMVNSLDIITGIFTSIGHSLVDGNEISAVLNYNIDALSAIDVFPSNMSSEKYYVVNSSHDTFQISNTNGGSPVTFISSPNLDLSKWHFEKITNPGISLTNIGGIRNCRLCISHISLVTSQFYLVMAYQQSFTKRIDDASTEVLPAYNALQLLS